MPEPIQRQQPDGSWAAAVPIPWQPGIDWEVYAPTKVLPYRAFAFHGPDMVATVEACTRLGLHIRMNLAHRRLKRLFR